MRRDEQVIWRSRSGFGGEGRRPLPDRFGHLWDGADIHGRLQIQPYVVFTSSAANCLIHSTGEASNAEASCRKVPIDGWVRPRSIRDKNEISIPD